jgi:hypothetical protein
MRATLRAIRAGAVRDRDLEALRPRFAPRFPRSVPRIPLALHAGYPAGHSRGSGSRPRPRSLGGRVLRRASRAPFFLNALLPLPEDGLVEALECLPPEQVPVTPLDYRRSIVDVNCWSYSVYPVEWLSAPFAGEAGPFGAGNGDGPGLPTK